MTGTAAAIACETLVMRRAGPADHEPLLALQRRAYARNRELLGVEPLPLLVDYRDVLAEQEVWVADGQAGLDAALILNLCADSFVIESIAIDPTCQARGHGRSLLRTAVARARALGYKTVRLYTGAPLTHLIAWYTRHGFAIERMEAMSDRSIVHMVLHIGEEFA